jgi:hypothetical protein
MKETTAERRLRMLAESYSPIDNGDRDACDIGREAIDLLASARVAMSKGGEHVDVDTLRRKIDALLRRAV